MTTMPRAKTMTIMTTMPRAKTMMMTMTTIMPTMATGRGRGPASSTRRTPVTSGARRPSTASTPTR
eukprot:8227253-Pyramimonas_sp.AAC.1